MSSCSSLSHMHRAASHCTVAVWLGSSSRRTEGGEGRRELTQRETGVLISDGLTGCVDRAVAQEEEKKRCNGGTSCVKRKKKRKTEQNRRVIHKRPQEREGRNRERSPPRGEKSFGAGRGSKLDGADKDTEEGKRIEKRCLTGGEKRGSACTKWKRRKERGGEGA